MQLKMIAEDTEGCTKVQQALGVDGEKERSIGVNHQKYKSPRERSAFRKAARKTKHTQMPNQTMTMDLNSLGVYETQSDSAISQQVIKSGEKLFYGAHIGNETRDVEFKRGGGEYFRSIFRSHLRRYACAFLNSGGGSLLVGVDDDGIVRGICCNHRQEDRARLLVDSTLKFFNPPLLPQSYSLTFVPVVRPGPKGVHLKVMRLTLRPPPACSQSSLYQTDQGQVFLRRDGSVDGPLSASAIQEWAKQKWSEEVLNLQQRVEALLAEQRHLLQEIRHQSMIISSLQNTHVCFNIHSHKLQPPNIRERFRQAFGMFGSQTAALPPDARRCHCSSVHTSGVPVLFSTQIEPSLSVVLSSSSDVSDPSLPGGHSHVWALDKCPGPPECQQKGKKENVAGSNICSLM